MNAVLARSGTRGKPLRLILAPELSLSIQVCSFQCSGNTPMGSFLVYQRFKAKYGAREVEAVMAPTPLNIRPMDHPQSVPECIAYRWVSQNMPKQLANTAEDRQRIARGGIAKHQPKTAKTGKYGKAKAKAGKAMMQLPAAMPIPINYGLMHLLNQAPQGPPPKAAAPAAVATSGAASAVRLAVTRKLAANGWTNLIRIAVPDYYIHVRNDWHRPTLLAAPAVVS